MKSSIKKYKTGIMLPFLFLFVISINSQAQRKYNVFYTNDRIEFRAGTGVLLNVIPLSLNDGKTLQIPAGEFGFSGGINYKHAFSPHFALGYQFDYLHFSGKVYDNSGKRTELSRAGTNAFGNSITLEYYLRTCIEDNYKFNYNIYYKLGALSLKLANGMIENQGIRQNISISDVGIGLIWGLGIGVYYRLNDQMALIWKADYNHISATTDYFYRLDKLFADTPSSVSHYGITTVGVSYRFSHKKKITLRNNLPFYKKNKRR